MSRWRLPELVKSKYNARRDAVIADKVWNELHENQYEIADLKRKLAKCQADNRQLIKQIHDGYKKACK